MKYFHYSDGVGVIRVKARSKPSVKTLPRNGSWVVRELQSDLSWQMPAFPEVGPATLAKLLFLGSVKILDEKDQ